MRAVPFAPVGARKGSQAGSKDEGDRQLRWPSQQKNRLHRVACGEQALLFVHRAPQHQRRMEKSLIQKISKPISEVTTH
jgi:hypothetical protein